MVVVMVLTVAVVMILSVVMIMVVMAVVVVTMVVQMVVLVVVLVLVLVMVVVLPVYLMNERVGLAYGKAVGPHRWLSHVSYAITQLLNTGMHAVQATVKSRDAVGGYVALLREPTVRYPKNELILRQLEQRITTMEKEQAVALL